MFQRKLHKIYKDLLNVFGIGDDIYFLQYDIDGKYHDITLQKVLQICRQVNLKLNKDKCHFIFRSVPFFSQAISRHAVRLNPQKLKVLIKKRTPGIPWNINYLSKFSPSTAYMYESLRQLALGKTEWTWNVTYQMRFDKANSIIKKMPV